MKRRIVRCAVAAGAIAPIAMPTGRAAAQATPVKSAVPLAQRLFAAVRPALSGDSARATVAFVESRWRLAGNRGFNESVAYVAARLRAAGFDSGGTGRLAYRVEEYPLAQPAWEPLDAALDIVGEDAPVLRFASNRNMLAINSWSTPPSGVEAEVVTWSTLADTARAGNVAGKVVLANMPINRLFAEAVTKRGAAGVLSYNMPEYTRPDVHTTSIQFASVPRDSVHRAFGILLSFAARDRLQAALNRGPVRVRVRAASRFEGQVERTVVAEVRGNVAPDERIVLSAHIQEPGANDNASGVGALAEMARTLALLVRGGSANPGRTITMLFGDEIGAPQRYLTQDPARANGVRWGLSLDMVGEDTKLTGGSFLIEKMPDPSAVWTRGEDTHTAWGGSAMRESDVRPHYYNDFVLSRCRELGQATGWRVSSNPYEGGSDHVPFLRAGKPGLLLWHFTDEFYHTDNDRLDKVSAAELANVSTCALVSVVTLASADGETVRAIARDIEATAMRRLDAELVLSEKAVASPGARREDQEKILFAWGNYYRDALTQLEDVALGARDSLTPPTLAEAAARIELQTLQRVGRLRR